MKILVASVRDTGGTGYNLAHAINKCTRHQCVNLRAMHSYINYPSIADMGDYSVKICREMVYNADVIVFLGYMKPFFEGLKLRKSKLQNKKKLLYETGSIWRFQRKQLVKEADKLLEQYKIMLGGSGMFLEYPEGEPIPEDCEFLPPTRSFSEIGRRHGLCNQDTRALESFGVDKQKVVFAHAPTSDMKKGTGTFYRAVTRAMQILPEMSFLTIRNQPWFSCLQSISRSDVLLDQDPPFPVGYGAISIEAAIFHVPVITNIDPRCALWIKQKTGLTTPFVRFSDEDDLMKRIYTLVRDHKLRRKLGQLNYSYCKKLHDEKPVVERFMKIVEEMN